MPPENITPLAMVISEEFSYYKEYNIIHSLAKEFGVLPPEILKLPTAYVITALKYQNLEARYNRALYAK